MCFAGTTPALARGGDLAARYEGVMQHAGPDLRLEGRGAAGADAEQLDRPVPYISAPRTNPSTPTVSAPRTVDGGATLLTLLGTSSDTRVRPAVSSQMAQANFALPSVYVNAAETRSIEVKADRLAGAVRRSAGVERGWGEFRSADASQGAPAVLPSSERDLALMLATADNAENRSDLVRLTLAAVLFVSLIAVVALI